MTIEILSRRTLADKQIHTVEYTVDGDIRADMYTNRITADGTPVTDYDDVVDLDDEELITWIEDNRI